MILAGFRPIGFIGPDVAGGPVRAGLPALVGGQTVGAMHGVYRRATLQEGVREGRTAVVLQRAEQGVGTGEITGLIQATGIVRGQIVALRNERRGRGIALLCAQVVGNQGVL